jgi:Icc-related predicted phosphoesterase
MKLVLISDTHTFHKQVTLPEGDVLIHAGDMGLRGSASEIQPCLDWLNRQPHKHVVAIAGNHDFAFERCPELLKLGRINYLENSSINIDGKNFYGSPVQPWFMDWAFNVQRGAAIKKYWDMIPEAGLVDVLITHGPPMGILDVTAPQYGGEHVGCEDLMKQVEISLPALHVFGHIHGGYGKRTYRGIDFYNASICDEDYKAVNKPWVVEI